MLAGLICLRGAVEAIINGYDHVRRCEYTGEILNGGNMYVSANISYTNGFKAEVESKMDECDINNLYRYQHVFDEIVEQMWVEHNAPVIVVADVTTSNEAVAIVEEEFNTDNSSVLTINEEKNGIEIRFAHKPSMNIRKALSDIGFKWTNYDGGKWWAKRTEERYNLAVTLVDTFNDVMEESAQVDCEPHKEDNNANIDGLMHDAPETNVNVELLTDDATRELNSLVNTDTHLHSAGDTNSNVVSFMDYVANKNDKANSVVIDPVISAEDKLKLMTIRMIMGRVETDKQIGLGISIDKLFYIVANAIDQSGLDILNIREN